MSSHCAEQEVGETKTGTCTATTDKLKCPSRPIWVVRGDNSYSLLWDADVCKEFPSNQNELYLNKHSSSFKLSSFNCWDCDMDKTEIRVIPSTGTRAGDQQKENIRPNGGGNDKGAPRPITLEEIERTEAHPDDQNYFTDFRRWRFCFHSNNDSNVKGGTVVGNEDEASKEKLKKWDPFFRLDRRCKEIVQRKMAPTTNLAIWSKWPEATIKNPCNKE